MKEKRLDEVSVAKLRTSPWKKTEKELKSKNMEDKGKSHMQKGNKIVQ